MQQRTPKPGYDNAKPTNKNSLLFYQGRPNLCVPAGAACRDLFWLIRITIIRLRCSRADNTGACLQSYDPSGIRRVRG